MQPLDQNFEKRVRTSFDAQGFMRHIGATLSEVTPGSVVIELDRSENITQQHGFIHAGAIASIADSACGYAALTLMPTEAAVLTVEYKINLLSPASAPKIRTKGIVKKAGKTLTYAAADVFGIYDDHEKPVASLVATLMTVTERGISD